MVLPVSPSGPSFCNPACFNSFRLPVYRIARLGDLRVRTLPLPLPLGAIPTLEVNLEDEFPESFHGLPSQDGVNKDPGEDWHPHHDDDRVGKGFEQTHGAPFSAGRSDGSHHHSLPIHDF